MKQITINNVSFYEITIPPKFNKVVSAFVEQELQTDISYNELMFDAHHNILYIRHDIIERVLDDMYNVMPGLVLYIRDKLKQVKDQIHYTIEENNDDIISSR